MPHFVRCIEGHVFDAQSTSQCPICGAMVAVVAAAPMPEAVKSAQPSLVAVASRVPMVLAAGGIGLGLLAAAAAIWIFLRSPSQSPVAHVDGHSADLNGPATSTPKKPSTSPKSAAALITIPTPSANSLQPASAAPVSPEALSNPAPSTSEVSSPALTTEPAASTNSLQSVNPSASPGIPSNAVPFRLRRRR